MGHQPLKNTDDKRKHKHSRGVPVILASFFFIFLCYVQSRILIVCTRAFTQSMSIQTYYSLYISRTAYPSMHADWLKVEGAFSLVPASAIMSSGVHSTRRKAINNVHES